MSLISLEYIDLSFRMMMPEEELNCILRHNLNDVCWFLFRQVSLKTHLDLTFFETIMRSLEAQYGYCYLAFLQYFWF
jgi:translation initiation factor 2 alpha subunit (eIF-2alpha)